MGTRETDIAGQNASQATPTTLAIRGAERAQRQERRRYPDLSDLRRARWAFDELAPLVGPRMGLLVSADGSVTAVSL
jgi:hypothetical protein